MPSTPLDKIAKTALKGEFAGADVQLQEALYYLGAIDLQKGRTEDGDCAPEALPEHQPGRL